MINQRNLCFKCFRAQSACYCAEVKPITPQTRFIILRHTLERRRTIGTAQITNLCLTNSILLNGREFDDHPVIQNLLQDATQEVFVLFPGPTSINIDTHPLPDSQHRTVVVIDGTWTDVKQILRFSPKIAALPKISFTTSKLSQYGFRQQPAPHCLSTVESIHKVLEVTEPELDASNLLHVFSHMVKLQLKYLSHRTMSSSEI